MSNSSLSTYTKISPNKNIPRNHVIDTITIHCTAGNKNNTAKQIVDFFANSERQASCNYVVGGDGSIGISVEERTVRGVPLQEKMTTVQSRLKFAVIFLEQR